MNRTVLPAAVLFLAIGSSAIADNPRDRWLSSFDEAQAEAKKSDKPIFLVFR